MTRYILEFTIEGGIEFFEQVKGVEFDGTADELRSEFHSEMTKYIITPDMPQSFILAGREFYYDWFTYQSALFNETDYEIPTVYTVDEWFDKERESDN